jgi:hypothetical protein
MSTRIARWLALTLGVGALIAAPAQADPHHGKHHGKWLKPGNLLVSTSVYSRANIEPGVTELPPGCSGGGCQPAIAGSAFPSVFNNGDSSSFGGEVGVRAPGSLT